MWNPPDPKPVRRLERIAILTSGGDAPGMNAAVRALVRTGLEQGIDVLGVNKGYSGLVEQDWRPLDRASVANILQTGGTILKSDRSDEFRRPEVRARTAEHLRAAGIEALVVMGGDGSLAGAHALQRETGFEVIGIPGTIDNDVFGTDDCIGFDTAVNTALDAIDRLRDTANSHERVFLLEVMGRSSGFIAAMVGIAGGAESVLMPGRPVPFSELCERLDQSLRRRKSSSLIVVAEGDAPGMSTQLTQQLTDAGFPARACILGHVQRGGSPTGHDRMLASVMGNLAVRYLRAGQSDLMLAVKAGEVTTVPLADIIGREKPGPDALLDITRVLAT